MFIGGCYWLVKSSTLNNAAVLIFTLIKGPDEKLSAETIADLLNNPYDEDSVNKLPEGRLKTFLRGLTGAKIVFNKPVRRKIIKFYKHILGKGKNDKSAMEKLRNSILDELDES